ncbi:MAG: 23S rRNA (adenine(2030)-N(6))-methyltransferase RlmJ [Rhodospirillales bacterium]|nr:23S rRNA (adenine(2030)-N(6))-methyltransferase RlmJ [Rhodospirillales bacterium]
MNYRHAYHAGGYTDAVKHAVLALLIERLKEKDAPFCVLDTHAGLGRYDLLSPEAQKTGEFRHGIARLLVAPALPAALAPYLAVVRVMNSGLAAPRWYPGSPRLALDLMRADDRLALVELHPGDAQTLAAAFAGDKRVKVHQSDGYVALKAFLPPPERRGLVLIDPPFEAKDEFARIVRGLGHAHRRWATGQYMVWYPIKHRAPVKAFHAALAASGIPRILVAELLVRYDDDAERLNGCGIVLVNPPWRMAEILSPLFDELLRLFDARIHGRTRVEILVPE